MSKRVSFKLFKVIFILLILALLIILSTIIVISIKNPAELYNLPIVGSYFSQIANAKNPEIETVTETENTNTLAEEDEDNEEEENNQNTTKEEEPEEVTVVSINENYKDLEPKEEELKELFENYSVGINRIDDNTNNRENNTVFLYVAKNFFDSRNMATLDIDTKYASTKDNIHKYMSELSTHDYTEDEPLITYTNLVKYVDKKKSYDLGPDISLLKREKYSVADINYSDNGDGTYSGTAYVLRSIKMEEEREITHYTINYKFKINDDYTYSKYKLLSFSATNKDFYPDNTYHLERN